jgi:penicillin-binding protein 1A
MRYAVKDRPVEKFNTDLKLPEWQLEPDEEWMYGNPEEDYYYIDEQGNLIEPAAPTSDRRPAFPVEGEDDSRAPAPAQPRPGPQAASDDFLEEATGRSEPPPQRRQPAPPPAGAVPIPRQPQTQQ